MENPDIGVCQGLVNLLSNLKAKRPNTILLFTPLSGDLWQLYYKPIIDNINSSCPCFDYVAPMLYNGGQYPYDPSAQINYSSCDNKFSWNCLLNGWLNSFISPTSKTKILASFITYSFPATPVSASDISHFANDYLTGSGGAKYNNRLGGIFFFYYSSDYDYNLLNILASSCMR